MEFSANSCLEICKSSAELVIKIQEFKDLERRGSGLSSLKLQKLTVSAGPSFQPRRLKATQPRVVGHVTLQEPRTVVWELAGWKAPDRICRNERQQRDMGAGRGSGDNGLNDCA